MTSEPQQCRLANLVLPAEPVDKLRLSGSLCGLLTGHVLAFTIIQG